MALVVIVAGVIFAICFAHASTHSAHPEAWVYGAVSIILIVTAGGISAARLKREQRLEAVIKGLLE